MYCCRCLRLSPLSPRNPFPLTTVRREPRRRREIRSVLFCMLLICQMFVVFRKILQPMCALSAEFSLVRARQSTIELFRKAQEMASQRTQFLAIYHHPSFPRLDQYQLNGATKCFAVDFCLGRQDQGVNDKIFSVIEPNRVGRSAIATLTRTGKLLSFSPGSCQPFHAHMIPKYQQDMSARSSFLVPAFALTFAKYPDKTKTRVGDVCWVHVCLMDV